MYIYTITSVLSLLLKHSLLLLGTGSNTVCQTDGLL